MIIIETKQGQFRHVCGKFRFAWQEDGWRWVGVKGPISSRLFTHCLGCGEVLPNMAERSIATDSQTEG